MAVVTVAMMTVMTMMTVIVVTMVTMVTMMAVMAVVSGSAVAVIDVLDGGVVVAVVTVVVMSASSRLFDNYNSLARSRSSALTGAGGTGRDGDIDVSHGGLSGDSAHAGDKSGLEHFIYFIKSLLRTLLYSYLNCHIVRE